MQHVIKKWAILSFLFMTLANVSQVYADGVGSYLYCVTEGRKDSKNAHWRYDDPANLRQKIDLSKKYPNVRRLLNMREGYDNRVWIEGTPANVGGQSTLSVEAYEANEVCKILAKMCTDEYGANYKYVGAGEGSVKGWNGISIYSHASYSSDKSCRCRNWEHDPDRAKKPGDCIQ